ncbi:SprT-like domain-containing protein [Segatella bryantii]|jgi:hypothetical protein|uniref:SprT-like domain-containing protein n=1 Tax=Segatella bryantii TaxID=77095 RepID=UPI00088F360C|nr:SprT-like domain-containing protein [Segatella bryantii]UKK72006.1 SprT-like domain-containing protein [Segatella bryantii]SDL94624.1 SprT-like family protein [Segatella bryantii]
MIDLHHENLLKRFDELNEKCFYGSLRRPKIEVRTYRYYVGQFYYSGSGKKKQPRIIISDAFVFNDKTLTEILTHEMIHYYLCENHKWGSGRHSWNFRRECRRIYCDYGIRVYATGKGVALNKVVKRRPIPLYEKVLYYIIRPFDLFYDRLC